MTVTIKEIFSILKIRWKLILFIPLTTILFAIMITNYLLHPVYESSALIIANQSITADRDLAEGRDMSEQDMLNTYKVVITSPRILNEVIKDLSMDIKSQDLKKQITVQIEEESQVISIIVRNGNPELAMKIANAITEVFEREIYLILQTGNVAVLSAAELPLEPISPHLSFNIAVATAVGLLAAFVIAMTLELYDGSVKTEEDVQSDLGLPLLGAIMVNDGKNKTMVRAAKKSKEISQ